MNLNSPDTISAAAAAASAVAAGAALITAHRAHKTAKTVARIESDRWLHELTPTFETALRRIPDNGSLVTLHLTLTGPVALKYLEGVSLTVRNDNVNQRLVISRNTPLSEVEAQVWGPLRFVPSSTEADVDGRTIPTHAMTVGDSLRLAMTKTTPPSWIAGGEEQWELMHGQAPLRLWADCRSEKHGVWRVPVQADIPPSQPAA
ncbi:hypothetical protein RM572_00275 [Streptomyces sp. DSM 42041]|uniref:Uncharacterized protein n=1 Tax=Streptomyces hazeniae TaxID=3075538 RepID=A0ABU2NL72_9ACTN|nr:hypothetical protein [Streptomyces sp. DSM 42041]MDT0377212.1 hypothetical protein [Streptomyces sp. DSM 42041]